VPQIGEQLLFHAAQPVPTGRSQADRALPAPLVASKLISRGTFLAIPGLRWSMRLPPRMRSAGYASRAGDALAAGLISAATGGIPSTMWALLTGSDPLEATRAAGAMLVDSRSADPILFAAAGRVPLAISVFWAALLAGLLPRRRTVVCAVAAAAAIAVLDLRVIGRFFPEIHALTFGPQLADHLAWGTTVGAVLVWRRSQARLNTYRPPGSLQ